MLTTGAMQQRRERARRCSDVGRIANGGNSGRGESRGRRLLPRSSVGSVKPLRSETYSAFNCCKSLLEESLSTWHRPCALPRAQRPQPLRTSKAPPPALPHTRQPKAASPRNRSLLFWSRSHPRIQTLWGVRSQVRPRIPALLSSSALILHLPHLPRVHPCITSTPPSASNLTLMWTSSRKAKARQCTMPSYQRALRRLMPPRRWRCWLVLDPRSKERALGLRVGRIAPWRLSLWTGEMYSCEIV